MSEQEGRQAEQTGGQSLLGPRIVAVAVLALALWILFAAFRIPEPGGYTALGPKLFPILVGFGLLGFGALFLTSVTVRPDRYLARKASAEEGATHWPTVGSTAAALVVYGVVLETLGYVIATGLFFLAVAYVLGSRRPGRDLLIGLALAAATYFGFVDVLGVDLPGGPLDLVF